MRFDADAYVGVQFDSSTQNGSDTQRDAFFQCSSRKPRSVAERSFREHLESFMRRSGVESDAVDGDLVSGIHFTQCLHTKDTSDIIGSSFPFKKKNQR